ncbi:HSP70/90 co-chaperone [Mycoemilia scoparia]|uniref:HSP70/90 co-chaperone n=1 Tax=Mycoemilia scoparia TaxID=417184 RepID=A0A9W7ZZ90_9FUNG|nr:HSP70/90 co-chaperone [Mycoemilia scoparia]
MGEAVENKSSKGQQPAGPEKFNVEGAFNPDNLDKELNSVPLFMRNLPKPDDLDDNVALAALQSLAYEGTPEEIALNFKEQGNEAFKDKNFRDAIKYYTQALEQNFEDDILRAVIFVNRAASNLELKNYRSAINDCAETLNIDQKNIKALFRSAKACYFLEKLEEAIDCCDIGLKIDPENTALTTLRTRCIARKEELDTMERKRQERREKRQKERKLLAEAIKIRGLKFEVRKPTSANESDDELGDEEGEKLDPWENKSGKQVILDENSGHLAWPVFFLYPEHKESDFVEAFDEATTLGEQISVVLQTPAPWDIGPSSPYYTPNNVDLYFIHRPENGLEDDEILVKVNIQCPLGTALSHPKYQIVNGIPSFIVLQKSGEFREKFLDEYRKRRQRQERSKGK